MRTLLSLAAAFLFAGVLHAQNAAPAKNNVPANVSPSTAEAATDQAAKAKANSGAPAPQGEAKVLDSVIAIVNGSVLLESDVEEEQRLDSLQMLPKGQDTNAMAAQRLITRTLIAQQMKAQQAAPANITPAQVAETVDQMRRTLPGCAAAGCQTATGWTKFLAARGLTAEEVNQRWHERLVILAYLNLRFQSGVRVPSADIAKYYQANVLPEFQSKHQKPLPLRALAPRIQEILLQQQVSKQIDDWEQTLREEGDVKILVPAYGQSTGSEDADDMGGDA